MIFIFHKHDKQNVDSQLVQIRIDKKMKKKLNQQSKNSMNITTDDT